MWRTFIRWRTCLCDGTERLNWVTGELQSQLRFLSSCEQCLRLGILKTTKPQYKQNASEGLNAKHWHQSSFHTLLNMQIILVSNVSTSSSWLSVIAASMILWVSEVHRKGKKTVWGFYLDQNRINGRISSWKVSTALYRAFLLHGSLCKVLQGPYRVFYFNTTCT